VAKLGSQFASYPENIFTGSGTLPNQKLSIGFRNATQLSVSNQSDTLNVSMLTPVDQYKLYTIRYSENGGYQVWVNGEIDPTASDPSMTGKLTSFLGTRLGSNNGNTVYLAEFKAYATAVTDLQRKSLDKALLVKYGL